MKQLFKFLTALLGFLTGGEHVNSTFKTLRVLKRNRRQLKRRLKKEKKTKNEIKKVLKEMDDLIMKRIKELGNKPKL